MDHFYQNIDGWNHLLMPLCVHLTPKLPKDRKIIIVEVGVWAGRTTAHFNVELINAGIDYEYHVVDHWKGCEEAYYNNDAIRARDVYQEFLTNLDPIIDRMNIHVMSSVEAAAKFEDASLDMVIIDDDHSHSSVTAGIAAWMPKIRPGGILAGDDHGHPYEDGVTRAIRDLFEYKYNMITQHNELLIPDRENGSRMAAWWITVD